MDKFYVLVDKNGHYADKYTSHTHTGFKYKLKFVTNINDAGVFSEWGVNELKKIEGFDLIVAKLPATVQRKVTLVNEADDVHNIETDFGAPEGRERI